MVHCANKKLFFTVFVKESWVIGNKKNHVLSFIVITVKITINKITIELYFFSNNNNNIYNNDGLDLYCTFQVIHIHASLTSLNM